jgi:hypothetical protein
MPAVAEMGLRASDCEVLLAIKKRSMRHITTGPAHLCFSRTVHFLATVLVLAGTRRNTKDAVNTNCTACTLAAAVIARGRREEIIAEEFLKAGVLRVEIATLMAL